MSHCVTCHRKGDWQPVHSDGSEAGGTLQEGGRIRGVGKVSGHCTERMDWMRCTDTYVLLCWCWDSVMV